VKSKKLKIGIDIHGVVTANPEFFSAFTKMLYENGHEIHIMTGPHREKVEPLLKKHNIFFTHFFSIVEEEEKNGKNEIVWTKNGDPFMDINVWDRAKAKYAKKHKIDLHIDDSTKYADYFSTPICVYRHDSQKPKAK
jgi:uncharacterized HAD superfamily protein